MDFDLSSEQQEIRKLAQEFAGREIAPGARDRDRNQTFPKDVLEKMAPLGLLGGPIPEKYGGIGIDYVSHVAGLSDEDMGGAMPGMQGMVHADSEAVIAYVTFTNNARRPVAVWPEQFHLITDTSDTTLPGSGSPLGTGDVQPGSALQTSYRFVIPRDEAHLWLEYRDPGTGSGMRFALGTAQQAPADGQGGHTH